MTDMEISDSDSVAGDADDPVDAEYPVFLSRELADSLYLLQFPAGHAPEQAIGLPVSGRLKPKTKQMELDVPLDTRDAHYDPERGAMMAEKREARKGGKAGDGYNDMDVDGYGLSMGASRKLLEKQTYGSSFAPGLANYCVGIFSEAALMQLRPTLTHLVAPPTAAAAPTAQNPHVLGANTNQKKAGDIDKAAMAREAARNAAKKKAKDEEWLQMEVGFGDASSFLQHLVVPPVAPSAVPSTDPSAYLDELSPVLREREQKPTKDLLIFRGMSLADVAKADLATQCKVVMTNTHILPLSRLLSNLQPPPNHPTSHVTATQVLPHLTSMCHLLRGLLVLRSSVLYSGRVRHARTIALTMFRERTRLRRVDVCAETGIGAAEARGILMEIGAYVEGEGTEAGWWELRYTDDDGLAEWPEVASEMERSLEKEAESARKELALHAKDAKAKSKVKIEQSSAPAVKRQSAPKIEGTTKVEINVEAAANAEGLENNLVPATPPTVAQLKELLAPFTELIHNTYVLLENPRASKILLPYREVVLTLFRSNTGIKKPDITAACAKVDLDPLSVAHYKKTLGEFAEWKGSRWVWKSGEHPVGGEEPQDVD
ncbi:DNA-directed RNA polymerase III subunit RPC5 [Gonapodya sp. JEL0774]|nr:DNA-directed RNA polymerase III subunit RPC5 [Gonapodya sp. JEL0774]